MVCRRSWVALMGVKWMKVFVPLLQVGKKRVEDLMLCLNVTVSSIWRSVCNAKHLHVKSFIGRVAVLRHITQYFLLYGTVKIKILLSASGISLMTPLTLQKISFTQYFGTVWQQQQPLKSCKEEPSHSLSLHMYLIPFKLYWNIEKMEPNADNSCKRLMNNFTFCVFGPLYIIQSQ